MNSGKTIFAQLTYRESLRDIQACLRATQSRLYHLSIRGKISRNTLAHANQTRDWHIYADFAQILIAKARKLCVDDSFGIELDQAVYALDSTTIDLCLALFPWAEFRKRKGAVKLHTLLDLHGNIPSVVIITTGKVHDINILDQLIIELGAIYHYAKKDYPEKLRRIRYLDSKNNKTLVFLTNHFTLPSKTIAELYRCRWQEELFFKWIKQHLRIKAFYGATENAVKTQIWIAISVYVLVAIVKKSLNLDHSLYTILQVLSRTLFEKMPIIQAFSNTNYSNQNL